MSSKIKDFYGKDVAEAIKEACDDFGVAQENLTIEVLETGSKGIFGLIRQKAHIRAQIQEGEEKPAQPPKKKAEREPAAAAVKKQTPPVVLEKESAEPLKQPEETAKAADLKPPEPVSAAPDSTELPDEWLSIVKDELSEILELMGCPSTVTVENDAGTARCLVSDEHLELLTSQDGRVLDSLQYLLRKIIAKKISGRIQLNIDVGNYREKRYLELKELAAQYSAQVKEDGKTQVIPSLNPSERRVVHVALQDDPDIRSRSVGDGLFKKVLIYKPGKGRKNSGRKRGRSRYRKKSNGGAKKESS
ncbi:MAG: Jag N-terminal domain-containing protein [Desulfofustis sp.]|jgi:spoIIIJ-associated protein